MILDMLKDGGWHTFEDIKEKVRVNENQMVKIVKFLEEYGFIIKDDVGKRIKLDEAVRKLLENTTS